jgi:RsiW-degrading membrane proteinase PrsW (M82 family)
LFSVAWTFLMSLAVVGAFWHTPLDVIGSILLSVGVVTGGATVFRSRPAPLPAARAERARVLQRV